jgi:hypothetical protein
MFHHRTHWEREYGCDKQPSISWNQARSCLVLEISLGCSGLLDAFRDYAGCSSTAWLVRRPARCRHPRRATGARVQPAPGHQHEPLPGCSSSSSPKCPADISLDYRQTTDPDNAFLIWHSDAVNVMKIGVSSASPASWPTLCRGFAVPVAMLVRFSTAVLFVAKAIGCRITRKA